MRKAFHNVKNSKKMLAYGASKGLGVFRPQPQPVKPTQKGEAANGQKESPAPHGQRTNKARGC